MKRFALILGLFSAFLAYAQEPWVYSDHPKWEPSWNQRPMPRAGVCFFKDTEFKGDHFCVTRGDKLDALPGSFGDNISSIQLFGKARVTVFNDREFRGGSQEFRNSIGDLRTQRFRDGHTWNDRISSVVTR